MQKKLVLVWASYDFANSIVVAVFLLYFSQWLVVDHHVSDIWYNLIFVASSVLLIITAPITSIVADQRAVKMPFLRLLTLAEFAFLILASISAAYFSPSLVIVSLAAVCFLLSNYLHQFAMIFYNALLPSIAGSKSEGQVSGFGLSAKLLGTVLGLAIAVPLTNNVFPLLGHEGRSQTFLPATLISLLLTIPPLFIEEPRKLPPRHVALTLGFKAYLRSFAQMCRHPGVSRYLIGYFLFNDAMLTVQDNMPIYMAHVLGVSDRTKSLILGCGLTAAAIGALIGGWVSDRVGLKRSLLAILMGWVVFLPSLSLAGNTTEFAVLFLIMGSLFGVTGTVTRATMAYLAPATERSYAFSYYTVAERFSTFVGPLVWGGLTTVLYRMGSVRYRIALVAMDVFVLAGLLVVRRIPSDKWKMRVAEDTASTES